MAEEQEKRRPGSGHLWSNKLTKATSPKFSTTERNRSKKSLQGMKNDVILTEGAV